MRCGRRYLAVGERQMFNEFISWFDVLPLFVILLVGMVLVLVEYFLSKNKMFTFKTKKWVLINIWQVFGVLLPVMWLLRAADNYMQVVPLVIMMVFFGVFKPARLQKISEQSKLIH